MYVYRQLEDKIKPFLRRKEVISIIGPRQAGKTTFIKHLEKELSAKGKKVKFFTFEKTSDLELFQESIEDFRDLISRFQVVIIDEFQYAKEGGKKLKYLYDTTDVKFIISGSSSLELTFQTGKYMVGRMLNFYLSPFSFREFLSFFDPELYSVLEEKMARKNIFKFNVRQGFGHSFNQRLDTALQRYVIYGGYPAVALSRTDTEKQKILESILENYLLKDIKSLLKLATDEELLRLSKFLAGQVGNLIKYEELANVSNLHYKEVLKHLNILENTFIIKLLKPFFVNKRKELSKNPKVYFSDLGLRNYLLNDFRRPQERNDLGALMENYAYILLRSMDLAPEVKFWRTKSKAEVDFIIEEEQKVYPIEVKYTSQKVIGKSLWSFIEKFSPPVAVVLTKDYLGAEKVKGTTVKFIPLSYF